MRNGGAAPDPSAQFSLFRLYIFKHLTFHFVIPSEVEGSFLQAGKPYMFE